MLEFLSRKKPVVCRANNMNAVARLSTNALVVMPSEFERPGWLLPPKGLKSVPLVLLLSASMVNVHVARIHEPMLSRSIRGSTGGVYRV